MDCYSSTNTPEPITLTADTIMQAVKLLQDRLAANPFQKLAKEKGFDLLKGDKMVIPRGFAEAHGITSDMCQGVIISDVIDCSIVFFKDGWEKLKSPVFKVSCGIS